jgi:hypothetical protein
MRLGLFSSGNDGKQEEKVAITQLDEIYQYTDRLKATVNSYDSKSLR